MSNRKKNSLTSWLGITVLVSFTGVNICWDWKRSTGEN